MSSNETNSVKEQFSTASELSASIEGNVSNPASDIYPHAGKVDDPETLSFLNMCEAGYDMSHPIMPASFRNSYMGSLLMPAIHTRVATNAINEGNVSQMKFSAGRQTYDRNANSLHVLRDMRSSLESPAYIQYLFGHMGNGKTDFAILEAEISKEELGFEIGSNIKSLEEKDVYIYSYGDLLQWLANGENVDSIDEIINRDDIDVTDKLFIFDEASSHASGYSGDAYETQEKLGTLVKKIRKVGGRMIIIGHTGKDVHPDIRRLCECVHKVSTKKASYYQDVKDAEGKGHKFDVSGIPKTNWNSYDSGEITSWEWSLNTREEIIESGESVHERKQSKEKRNVQIASMYAENPEMSYEDIVYEMNLDLSPQQVGNIVRDIAEQAKEIKGDS